LALDEIQEAACAGSKKCSDEPVLKDIAWMKRLILGLLELQSLAAAQWSWLQPRKVCASVWGIGRRGNAGAGGDVHW